MISKEFPTYNLRFNKLWRFIRYDSFRWVFSTAWIYSTSKAVLTLDFLGTYRSINDMRLMTFSSGLIISVRVWEITVNWSGIDSTFGRKRGSSYVLHAATVHNCDFLRKGSFAFCLEMHTASQIVRLQCDQAHSQGHSAILFNEYSTCI